MKLISGCTWSDPDPITFQWLFWFEDYTGIRFQNCESERKGSFQKPTWPPHTCEWKPFLFSECYYELNRFRMCYTPEYIKDTLTSWVWKDWTYLTTGWRCQNGLETMISERSLNYTGIFQSGVVKKLFQFRLFDEIKCRLTHPKQWNRNLVSK